MRPASRIFTLAMILLAVASCRKDKLYTGSTKLGFSVDTVFFDTIFTTVGSLTERLKIYNPYDQAVEISQVWLRNGAASNFKLNVDGFPGKYVEKVRIEPRDSIFVFVEVTIDPNGGNTPMVVEDQMLVETNGTVQHVDLLAWGRDAYFFPSSRLKYDVPVTLFTDKPNVFYGYTLVDTGTTLIIPCGAEVYFHPNAGLIVGHEASLKILGCEGDPVVLQGDRLEDYFEDVPGQWLQIFFSATSRDNEIRNAIIKNGTLGIRVDSNTNENPSLILENTQILNMSYIGLLGQTARIEARNTVVANCGDYAVALAYGGDYYFNHCTFANYWSGNPRSKPALLLNNYFVVEDEESGAKTTYARDLNVVVRNSIVHGELDSELERDKNKTAAFEYVFDHVILKLDTEQVDNPVRFISVLKNPSTPAGASDPLFEDKRENDYHLFDLSRARDRGKLFDDDQFDRDLDGNMRIDVPDLGAFEFIP